MRIPTYAEVAWLDGAAVPYWRGRVTQAEYEPGR